MTKRYLCIATILFTAFRLCAATPVRVALIGTGDGIASKEAISLAVAKLSEAPGVQLVERSSVDLIFRELKTDAVFGDQGQRARMGQLLGADYFVWLTMPGGTLEVADAQSGESIVNKKLDPQSTQGMADAICAEVKALKAPEPANPNAVAFTISRTPDENLGNEALIAAVIQQLQQAGVPVLHRRYIDTVIVEHLWQEKGLAGSGSTMRPLAGARFLVGMRFENSSVEMAVLDTKNGARLAQHAWPADNAKPAAEWLEGILLKPPEAAVQTAPKKGDAIQPETLAPLYEAILLHNQGRYFESSDLLRRACESDDRLLPALRWLQSCYRLGGFGEISVAIDDYLKSVGKKPQWDDKIINPKNINAAEGVALLGLTVNAQMSAGMEGPLTMALIDALHATTGKPVLLTQDIAQLRAEYDVLAGLENVQGTTWHEAPALLLTQGITAHLEPAADGNRQLRLCMIRALDPQRIYEETANLPPDSSRWRGQITAALRKLLSKDASAAGDWKPPKPVIVESEEELSRLIATDYGDATLLKLLHLNPEQLQFFWRFPKNMSGVSTFANALRTGIQDWIWTHIPRTSAQWPWIDLQYIEARHYLKIDEYLPLLRAFAERNNENPAGAVARFNLLLYDLDESNMAETQGEIERLLPVFRKMPEKQFPGQRIGRIEEMDKWLRCAMGQPVANAVDLQPCGAIHHPQVFMPDPPLVAMSHHVSVTKNMREWYGDESLQPARCKVDVAFYHFLIRRTEIPVPFMKRIVEEHAKEPALLNYIMVGYGRDFFYRKEFQPGDIADAAEIYDRFVDVIVGILSSKPAKLSAFDTALIIDRWRVMEDQMRSQPAFQGARKKLSKAVVQAFIDERFPDGMNGDYCMLLLDRADAFDEPECDGYLRERAERSWQTNPIRDSFWSSYLARRWDKFTPEERTEELLKHLPDLHTFHANTTWSYEMAKLYIQFANGFFIGEKYDEARDVLEEMMASKGRTITVPETEIRARGLYLLAMLHQRDGDIPGALRTAQEALDQMNSDTFRAAGLPLRSVVTDYIGKLRADPKLPFINPYAAATPAPSEKTPAPTPGTK